MKFNLPEGAKIVGCYNGLANGVVCDVVSMKNLNKGWFLVYHVGANDTDLVLTVTEATDVAAGTNQTITKDCRAWIDADQGTSSDQVAATTAAKAFTIDPATQNGVLLIIEIDPAQLSAGYDCVYLADAGGNAGNYCSILFIGEPKWQGASLPSVITN